MAYDKKFWDHYNRQTIKQLESLMSSERQTYVVDLHIHTDWSADGEQSVAEVIQRARDLKFDVISITDHDSVESYKEIPEILQSFATTDQYVPIVLTGIEFTVRYDDYGDMCHILKYGINPRSHSILSAVKLNESAFWNRAQIQFQRVSQNPTLRMLSKRLDLTFTFDEYNEYLTRFKVSVPEYPTLISYIHSKLADHNIRLGELFMSVCSNALGDTCEPRREMKLEALRRFEKKYSNLFNSTDYPARVLSPILATPGIDDDDFTECLPSGNLSVRNYGQLDISDLPDEGLTVFAHPSGNQLHLMSYAVSNLNIQGIELNHSNRHAKVDDVLRTADELNVFLTRGSDNHGPRYVSYENMDFYQMPIRDLQRLYQALNKISDLGGYLHDGKPINRKSVQEFEQH